MRVINHGASELEQVVLNGLGMAVRIAAVLHRIADDMKLFDTGGWDFPKPFERVKAVIAAVDEQVGNVEQQAAIRLLADQKVRFRQLSLDSEVGGNVFENDRTAASLCNLAACAAIVRATARAG